MACPHKSVNECEGVGVAYREDQNVFFLVVLILIFNFSNETERERERVACAARGILLFASQ